MFKNTQKHKEGDPPNINQNHSGDNQTKYNPIFEKLVIKGKKNGQEEDYLIGMLAYAEYKEEKYKWIKSHPNAEENALQAYLDHYSDENLDKLRERAKNFLYDYGSQYANYVVKEKLDNYKEDVVKKSKTPHWQAVVQGFIASASFTAALFLLAVVIQLTQPNSNFGKLLRFLLSTEQYEIKLIEKDSN